MPINFPVATVEQYLRTFRISAFTVDADEKRIIFSSNMDGKVNLWACDVERPFPYPLTTMGEACADILPDPQGRYLLATFDHDGDENWQLFALPPNGGEPMPVLQADGEKFYPADLSPDGKYLYYSTSQHNKVYLNSYRLDLETKEQTLLHEGAGVPTYLHAIAPDGSVFTTVEAVSNTVQYVYVHREGERTPLRQGDSPHAVIRSVFMDADTLYFLTDEDDDLHYLARYDVPTGQITRVLRLDGQDMVGLRPHREGNALYIVTMQGVSDRMYKYDVALDTATEVPLPYDTLDGYRIGKSGTVYVLGRSANVPFNISRSRPDGTWEQLTDNRVFGVDPASLRDADVVQYKSFDGLEIESLLFRPQPDRANGYTIFWPHGGPQAAERKFYRSSFQAFLAAGYTIFAPNFRGSTGYGTKFRKLVERDWGHGPRLDNMAGVEWLIAEGIADRDKIFLMGGSYGGYMALLLHGRHPEYWRAVVDIFGPSNLFTFIESVPDHWRPMMDAWVGNPERDKEKLTEDSPHTYLDGMTKPMFVVQGANDPRVVKAESDQIVAWLREQGRDVEYMVLDDEGHGFSRIENEIAVYKRILQFLAKHH